MAMGGKRAPGAGMLNGSNASIDLCGAHVTNIVTMSQALCVSLLHLLTLAAYRRNDSNLEIKNYSQIE